MIERTLLQRAIKENVSAAITEDVGSGDVSAQLIAAQQKAKATILTREAAILCGRAWAEQVFLTLDPQIQFQWHAEDGDLLEKDQSFVSFSGNARALLTGERSALNFLQSLSGTATRCRHYANLVQGTGVKLLDTRKTLPGLRVAQKYAVTQGGCFNHRIGLYDAFLIKENHIMACGSIAAAISKAREVAANKAVELEVENLGEFEQALDAGADIIMLDNFSLADLDRAVAANKARAKSTRAKLEASGGITEQTLRPIAQTGVDYISIGALTKDCIAIDLSMRFEALESSV